MIWPRLTRHQWVLCFILSIFWTLFIHFFGSQHHTFKTKWQDNVSNISSARLFSLVGFEIYKNPLSQLAEPLAVEKVPARFLTDVEPSEWFWRPELGPERPLFFVWPEVARPYPVGAWIWYSPYSLMVYDGGFSVSTATFFSCLVFLILAHVVFFIFWQRLRTVFAEELSSSGRRFFKFCFYFFFFVLYCELVRWSGQGQYDLVAMIPLAAAYFLFMSGDFKRSILFFAVALNFHFRVLFSLGLLVSAGMKMIWRPRPGQSFWTAGNWLWLGPSLLLGLLAGAVFFWNAKYLTNTQIYKLNDYHYSLLGQRPLWQVMVFLGFGFGFMIWFYRKRLWDFLWFAVFSQLILMTTPQMRGWYVMFLFPMFLLLNKDQPARRAIFFMAFLFYIYLASAYMNQSPFDFTFIRELIEIIGGNNSD